jgi:hypothetical protein
MQTYETQDSMYSEELIVDVTNGVGASKLTKLLYFTISLGLQVWNYGNEGEGSLNEVLGAYFVPKEKVLPHGFQLPIDVRKRYMVTREVLWKVNQMFA